MCSCAELYFRSVVMVSQNAFSRSTRFSGGLPAMRAQLSAPIEMPAIQSGSSSASLRAW